MYKESPGTALAYTGAGFLGLSIFWTVFLALALVLFGIGLVHFARQARASGKFGS